MSELKDVLLSEIEEFREKGNKFLNGEMSMMEFKGQSGGMGVYGQKGGKDFMIRLRIPSGIINKRDLKQTYEWASKYGLDKVHLTTRQAIQLHGITIDNVCEIMREGIEKDIFTRGAGGNFPRNVAISPLSGVDKNEEFDVTPYAIAAGNHFLNKIYTYKLPRKLKVSFSSNKEDEAHCTIQDLGFLAVKKDGKETFTVYSGGGLGRNPKKAIIVAEDVNPTDVLYHIEAMTNMFMAEGDYENKNKARIRYILDRMGEDEYIKCYHKHLEEAKAKKGLEIEIKIDPIDKPGKKINKTHPRLIEQKQDGLYSVYFHPIGGQFMLSDMKALIDAVDSMNDVQMRLSMSEGIYIINLNGDEAEKILDLTQGKGGETLVEQSVSCIGVPICQVGLLNSQCALHESVAKIKSKGFREGALPVVHFSGCGNSCGVHQIGEIGFTGKKKRVNDKVRDVFELHFGGDFRVGKTNLGEVLGDVLAEEIPNFLCDLGDAVIKTSLNFKEWTEQYNDDFKSIVNKYLV